MNAKESKSRIKNKENSLEGLVPNLPGHENVPPFLSVAYSTLNSTCPDLPKISFQSIYSHMILRQTEDMKPINNSKGLDKAVRHFEAGDISQMEYSIIDDSLMYVKALCMASMKKQRYSVFASLTNKETVSYAYCQCPIGLAQSCSHIGALLFALNALQRNLYQGESCTSKPCQWNVPRPMKLKPTPLSEWNLKKPKIADNAAGDGDQEVKKTLQFDPRHPTQRDFDLSRSLQQLKELKRVFPNTGMSQLWHIPDETPHVAFEEEVYSTVDPREVSMQSLVFCKANLPLPITLENKLSQFIEEKTRGQRINQLWRDLHMGRITSSMFGAVLHAGSNPTSLVNQILHGSNLNRYHTLPKQVQWGIDHEKTALDDYLLIQSAISNISVEEAGLTLYPTHSFLGASSDGWISDPSLPHAVRKGCLEIKCPYSIKGTVITDREVEELLQYKDFCLERTEQGPQLKRSHPYYAQVQGEMAIMEVSWCDFVVWTNAPQGNCFIERIQFDASFVSEMMPRLVEFFVKHIMDHYVNHEPVS